MTARADRPPRGVVIGITVFAAMVIGVFTLIVVSVFRSSRVDCPLCEAVATKDPAQVRTALDDGAPIAELAWQAAVANLANRPDGEAEAQIAKLLLDRGADPNASFFVGGTEARRSAVQPAASRVWASSVLAQADASADLTEAMLAHGLDPRGQAAAEALIAATIRERLPAVRALLAAGVPANRVDGQGGPSALARAIQTRNSELIDSLEAAGALEW